MKITREIKRKIIQVAAFGWSNPYLGNFADGRIYEGSFKQFCNPGLNCYSCPAAQFACPIGAMQAVANSPGHRLGLYAMGFVLALGVVLGRVVCGFLCPFGLLQELLHKIPTPKFHLPKWMTYIKYGILAIFVLLLPAVLADETGIRSPAFCKYICPSGTLFGGLPILSAHPELRSMLGSIFTLKMGILIAVIIGCILVSRCFCKVMCPLGAIYGLLNKVSIYSMDVDNAKCVSCGKCASICPMDADPAHNPNSAECIRCGRCITACPTNSLSAGFVVTGRNLKEINNNSLNWEENKNV